MVWFQCEDCGENLKKPKLPNHFRACSANKLSCIDCGEVFGRQSVQGHTQCITEAEKYGPKGQGKVLNGVTPKPKNDVKQKPDVDINVGLSEHAPWFCSLCNTKATSRQTLLLHADGKKHRAKARAFHASKQQPKQTEESTPNSNVPTESIQKDGLLGNEVAEEPKEQEPVKIGSEKNNSEAENGNSSSKTKRKLDASESDGAREIIEGDTSAELRGGEVIQVDKAEAKEAKSRAKKAKHSKSKEDKIVEYNSANEDTKKKIKWKKLIYSILKSSPDGVLKLKKLKKRVLEAIRESGITEDENKLCDMLDHKITSSSRFTVEIVSKQKNTFTSNNKYVRLVAKN